MGTSSLKNEIKKPKSRVFRRAFVKRRDGTTGQFESDWQEITKDVRTFGKVRIEADPLRLGKFKFSTARVVVANDSGRYNEEDEEQSLWYNYASRQRSLVKIEAGYLHQTIGSDLIWTTTEYPTDTTAFIGIISGDIPVGDKNTISFNVKPLTQVFRDYPGQLLEGLTTTGKTASEFIELLRDQTDGSGNFFFRPFFGDTVTNWDISTTTVNYTQLNTNTGKDVRDKNCWEIIESLAEAENHVPYITRNGVFTFSPRSEASVSAFEFYGAGYFNSEYGHTIKKINSFGESISKFYSRISLKWINEDTFTSYEILFATITVNGTNAPWNLGYKSFDFENFWIPTETSAETIVQGLFNDYSVLKDEIDFTTTFVPQIDVLDKVTVSYDSTDKNPASRWDNNDWDTELIWDDSQGDAINLDQVEFKVLSVEQDYDKMETKIKGREV